MLRTQRVLEERGRFDRIVNIAEKYVARPGASQAKEGVSRPMKIEDKIIDPVFTLEIRDRIFAIPDPDLKMKAILDVIDRNLKKGFERIKFEMEFIVGLLYPKIDYQVSATTNHLLKAPFNIHASSMALSVPLIDVASFDIKNCLDLNDLTDDSNPATKMKGRLKHSFADYVSQMERFCEELEKEAKREREGKEKEMTPEELERQRTEFDWDN